MLPKNARKRAAKAPDSNSTNTLNSTITLGEEEPPTALITPPDLSLIVKSSYPLRPLLLTPERTLHDTQETIDLANDTQLDWQPNEELEVVVKEEKLY